MTAFPGKDYYLIFTCGKCGDYNEEIMIDLDNPNDKNILFDWLKIHSANGGSYETVLIQKPDRIDELVRKMNNRSEGFEQ
jgi:hypothetical protein